MGNGRKRRNARREKKAELSRFAGVKQPRRNNPKYSADNNQNKQNKTNAVLTTDSTQYSTCSQNETIVAPVDVHDEPSDSSYSDTEDFTSQKAISQSLTASYNGYSSQSYLSERRTYPQYTRYNHGQCGLNNLGNTCFMNSILQCLNNVPPLVEHYRDPNYRSFLSYRNRPVSTTFADLIESMRTADTVRPDALKSAVSKYAPLFGGYGQQDSHEYLTALLDALHQESSTEAEDGEERSIITELFQGQMQYTIKCSAASRCQNVTISIDPFLDIPVFIDEKFTSCPMFKVRFFTMDGHEKIISFPYSSTDTIQSIIDHLQKTSSYSFGKRIIAMKVSADNKFFARYRLSAILETIDDQLTIFYEIDDNDMNPITICLIHGENWDGTGQISHHPPLLLKLSEWTYVEQLHTCLSNHFHSSELDYVINDDSKCDADAAAAFSLTCQTETIVINVDEEKLQQLRSKFQTQHKKAIVQGRQLSNVTLEQCLVNNICVVERMSPNSTWFCSHCQRNRQLTKENHILSLPQVLIIHLKRFDMESPPPRTKIETFVKYPLELNMTKFLSTATSSEEYIYDLIGVSLHSGSFEGGHYIAYAKTASGWFCFNDSSVDSIRETEVISKNAYVLFYLRRV
jgi:ubiquitin C-terminal hydrolase